MEPASLKSNFDKAHIRYPDGRLETVTPVEFYAIPLGSHIESLTSSRIKFEKDSPPISPMDALKKK